VPATKIRITKHAKRRMKIYGISKREVVQALQEPNVLLDGHSGRKIAQKRLNSYVLRVIFEERDKEVVVITVYRARRERYEI